MISVCIPTYNGGKFIEEQVRTILDQIDLHDEIIISDDGSTDDTLKILNDMHDSRIKIYLNQKNKSDNTIKTDGNILSLVSKNVQNAISKASGDFIFLSDQDDIWLDGRVRKTIELLKNKEPTTVICNCRVVDESGKTLIDSYFSYISPSSNLLRTLYKSSYHGCCMAFNRAVLEKAFPFPKYSLGHDFWLGLISAHYGAVHFVEEPLLLYRRHSSTVTNTGFASTRSLYDKIKYRVVAIISIARRVIVN